MVTDAGFAAGAAHIGSTELAGATSISVTDHTLVVELADGRTISVPLDWYPRLVHATREERNRWELHADDQHIHWPDLDEDLSVESLLAGRPSGESKRSFERWLEARESGRSVKLYDLRRDERARERQE